MAKKSEAPSKPAKPKAPVAAPDPQADGAIDPLAKASPAPDAVEPEAQADAVAVATDAEGQESSAQRRARLGSGGFKNNAKVVPAISEISQAKIDAKKSE